MRVLIVEDEMKMAALLLEGLREHGLAAEICSRGDEALLKLQAGEFDAAVLDIMLPGLDGIALTRSHAAHSDGLRPWIRRRTCVGH